MALPSAAPARTPKHSRSIAIEVFARGDGLCTELTQTLPTAVVQAFTGTVIDTHGDTDSARQPFQIDRRHAPRADGETVRTHCPRRYRQGVVSSGTDTAPQRVVAALQPQVSRSPPGRPKATAPPRGCDAEGASGANKEISP